jgi:hypothetical protein
MAGHGIQEEGKSMMCERMKKKRKRRRKMGPPLFQVQDSKIIHITIHHFFQIACLLSLLSIDKGSR